MHDTLRELSAFLKNLARIRQSQRRLKTCASFLGARGSTHGIRFQPPAENERRPHPAPLPARSGVASGAPGPGGEAARLRRPAGALLGAAEVPDRAQSLGPDPRAG